MSRLLKAASEYLSRGWQPLPVPYRSKNPGLRGWQEFILVKDDLEKHFKEEQQNIGVLLGEKSGGLVDIDLDATWAIRLADYFLPPTGAEFGRISKPRSHRLYISDFPKVERFLDPFSEDKNDSTISEIRSTGGQTIFPGSTHESGESIEWVNDNNPARVKPEDLRRAVGLLNTACVLVRFWETAPRHDASLALSGALLRSNFSVEEVKKLISAICFAAKDDEMVDRLKAVDTTCESLSLEKSVYGFPKLAEIFSEKLVDTIRKFLNIEGQLKAAKTKQQQENQATRILHFAENLRFFHTPDRECYATIEINEHDENLRLDTRDFKVWLSYQFFKAEGSMPNSQALGDAIRTLEGSALFECEEQQVFIRMASFEGKIYLDLCNETWQIVEIDKRGWRIIESKNSPVKFRRAKGMLLLPMPAKTGDVAKLRKFLNVDDAGYILILGWLVNCFRPDYPFPIIIFNSEQGSGKSTTTKLLRDLVDPNITSFRSAPRNEHDLVIAANNSWICAFDNLSRVPDWLSDALCRLSTGGGFGTRTLYENDEETIFAPKRPIMINGIGDLAHRGDLLDRALLEKPKTIPEEMRKTETEFWAEFEKERPGILSGLLAAVSSALREIDTVKLPRVPRMADFATWVVAAEPALGLPEGSFLKAYIQNRDEVNDTALEGVAIADTVKAFCVKNASFYGTMKEFLAELNRFVDEDTRKQKEYPKNARGLRSKLERINPNLRAIGIDIKFLEKTDKGRMVSLECSRIQPSEPSDSQEALQTMDLTPDGIADGSTIDRQTVSQPSANRQGSNTNNHIGLDIPADVPDGSDGWIQGFSNDGQSSKKPVDEVI